MDYDLRVYNCCQGCVGRYLLSIQVAKYFPPDISYRLSYRNGAIMEAISEMEF